MYIVPHTQKKNTGATEVPEGLITLFVKAWKFLTAKFLSASRTINWAVVFVFLTLKENASILQNYFLFF